MKTGASGMTREVRKREEDFSEPGEAGERWLLGWGLLAIGLAGACYGLFGIVTGKILAENRGSWSILEREDARWYGSLILLVGCVFMVVGWRHR